MRSALLLSIMSVMIACSSSAQRETPTPSAPPPSPPPVVTIDSAPAPAPAPLPDAAPPPDAASPPDAALHKPLPPVATGDPSACKTDGDCVVHCPSAPGCCSSAPCGCRGAVAHGREADDDAAYAKSCKRPPQCPIVDCRYDEAFSAACVNGHCVGRSGPDSVVAPGGP